MESPSPGLVAAVSASPGSRRGIRFRGALNENGGGPTGAVWAFTNFQTERNPLTPDAAAGSAVAVPPRLGPSDPAAYGARRTSSERKWSPSPRATPSASRLGRDWTKAGFRAAHSPVSSLYEADL
jgi:hypothetical protein